ncbi:amidase [Paenibacillus sp. 1011MAR3C5]|uniref:amidase family protein n=1 Tax=Paenibacillus sp. 1011MAR3C5 TaxID=1675787 RepID=UPI000E6C6291|nr:amidase family protein [Paenibacillus sp. 1011MAR3C5]RJE85109.1 amidase [Paenibacillus sp. 1011MAR3C5]
MIAPLKEWMIEADIRSLQSAMESGRISSEELTLAYIDRIREINPLIHAVLELNPDAIDIARSLDAERKERGSRGELHGIPILVKDNIDTGDRMHTSAGSAVLANNKVAEDAFIAARLRKAGAVLLGKTNMTEWSNFMSSRMPAGYSSRGGQVLNPYGPGEVFVSGSSSGSAAAVAASLAAAAIGTETAGSIVGPAAQHALVGIKPTVGLASRSGIIPISFYQDTPGPLARTVEDAAILLGAIVGWDEQDSLTEAGREAACLDYTAFLDAAYVAQARIGIPRPYYKHLDEERLAIMEDAIAALRREGATIVDDIPLPVEYSNWNQGVVGYEFKQGINAYLARLDESSPVHSLTELIAYHRDHAELTLAYGQDTLEQSEATELTEEQVEREQTSYKKRARREGIEYLMKQERLDALLLPGDADGKYMAARMGYPLICVPAGYSANGIIDEDGDSTKGPFGVIFSGPAFSEPTLIKLAYGFEQATRHRIPPKL